jgi:hypothetical protein
MIGWPRTLAWSDFTAIPESAAVFLTARNGHPIVARVSISIGFLPGNSPRSLDGRTFNRVDVRVNIDRLEYVPSRLPAAQSAAYLRHEQGHVDLMGLFAREMEVRLSALRGSTAEDLTRQAEALVNESVAQARMYAVNAPGLDCVYDHETNHGMNRSQQDRWNSIIARNMAVWNNPNFTFQT